MLVKRADVIECWSLMLLDCDATKIINNATNLRRPTNSFLQWRIQKSLVGDVVEWPEAKSRFGREGCGVWGGKRDGMVRSCLHIS